RFEPIIEFAGLEEFLDLKLKNYSSGMLVRLAFSFASQVDADILLIDEVLSVGDAAFQQKCYDQFDRLKAAGKTIVFVTHDMGAVERFCHRAMLLERGRILDTGDPAAIARKYRQVNFGHLVHDTPVQASDGARAARITGAWFEDPSGERIASAAHGDPCVACIEVRFEQPLEHPVFGITIRNDAGSTVFATTTALSQVDRGRF